MADKIQKVQLIDGGTANTVVSETMYPVVANMLFVAEGSVSASTGAATIVIAGRNGGEVWNTIDTLSLTLGTAATADFGSTTVPWDEVRASITAISGTNATVDVWMSTGNY